MKKIFLNLLVLLSIGGNAWAGDTPVIEVADVEALPGETVSFAVNLTDGKANTYTAMTLYAQFPTAGFTTTGAYTVSDAWTGTSAAVGDVDETGLATIPFASSNKIPGAQDNLATVSFKVAESVAVGEYDVTLKGTLFEYNTSDKDYAANVTFKVKVVSAHTVILDETSITAPTAATGVNVRVKRSINSNEWSTICLSFAMTATQCQTAFGSDVLLGDFTGCDVDADNNVKAKFASVTAIEANHPYIIKVGTVISEFAVNNVNVAAEEEPSVDKDEATTGSGRNKVTTYNSFIGNYVNGTTVPDYALFLNGGKFYFSKGATKIKGFRGYFDFATAGAEYEESRLFIVFNEATGIDSMHHSECTDEVYNLKGQRVDQPAKGLYIKGGKKVIIK